LRLQAYAYKQMSISIGLLGYIYIGKGLQAYVYKHMLTNLGLYKHMSTSICPGMQWQKYSRSYSQAGGPGQRPAAEALRVLLMQIYAI